MDEPLSGLDYGYQARLLARFINLAREGRAILFSTHSPDHALRVSTRVVVLHGGSMRADGAPRDVVTPELIRSLYGVEVSIAADRDGRTALIPDVDRCIDMTEQDPRPPARTDIAMQ
jgi:iron complex transport system ATP-binding protein